MNQNPCGYSSRVPPPPTCTANPASMIGNVEHRANIRAVTNHAADYYFQWYAHSRPMENSAALLLLGAGRGGARLPTCEQVLRYTRFHGDEVPVTASGGIQQRIVSLSQTAQRALRGPTAPTTEAAAPTVLLRALSLLRPHELRALRVADSKVAAFIVSISEPDTIVGPGLSQALASLCAVEWPSDFHQKEAGLAITLIERHAATIRELICPVHCDGIERPLERCTQLESLTGAYFVAPIAWLGLKYLHTLRGADLRDVSFAAIAAALPQLHTLEVMGTHCRGGDHADHWTAFFQDLLPRLQVFEWQTTPWRAAAVPSDLTVNAAPVLRIQNLTLHPQVSLPALHFIRAEHVALCVQWAFIAQWLTADDVVSGLLRPLSRVRSLTVQGGGSYLGATEVAQILRAAPQLRTLTADARDVSWCHGAVTDPALIGLRHHCLQRIRLFVFTAVDDAPLPQGCAAALRRAHFPRLRVMIVKSVEYFADDGL